MGKDTSFYNEGPLTSNTKSVDVLQRCGDVDPGRDLGGHCTIFSFRRAAPEEEA